MNKFYNYYVVYNHDRGMGACDYKKETRIKASDDIFAMCKVIEKNNPLVHNVIIVSWILMEG
jgi:hypothetical protein